MNQSIVQQLTMEGNIRRRVRKASPNGDMHSTMWMLVLTRLMYCQVNNAHHETSRQEPEVMDDRSRGDELNLWTH